MGEFKYKDSTVKAIVYFKHPSGHEGRWLKSMYEVDETEYARLQEAFSAFEQGIDNREVHVLQLANKHEVTLRLDEVCGVLHNSRELILS